MMTTAKFEGFEKSAPRAIPATRTEEQPPAELDPQAEESGEAPKKRRRVGKLGSAEFDGQAGAVEADEEQPQPPGNNGAPRVESAWDAPSYPSIQEFAKAFVDHTESMLSRVLEKEAEIARLQQKMVDRLTESSEFNKKDAAFVGLIAFIMLAFGLLYFLKG